MEIYIEYENLKRRYHETQNKYNDILNEKEQLFKITQPGAVITDKEIISSIGKHASPFDNYLILKEKKNIDERLSEARSLLIDRQMLLNSKEEELRLSKNWLDIIYTYYYLDKLSIRKIEKKLTYKYDYPISKSEIQRKLEIIKKKYKSGTKRDKRYITIVL